jgi:L-lysine 2,3-aminomutase
MTLLDGAFDSRFVSSRFQPNLAGRIPKRNKTFGSQKLYEIEQLKGLPPEVRASVGLAAKVFPFKVNEYCLETLIDWDRAPDDPIFRLLFPMAEMLDEVSREHLAHLVSTAGSDAQIEVVVREIRRKLNPHSSNQLINIPFLNGEAIQGLQHKYPETVLFFPKQGQTCHSYCSFCFRWPQFVESGAAKFEADDASHLHSYLRLHQEVSDLLVTGGDPMVMNTRRLRGYLEPLLGPDFAHVKNIRIGTKSLTYWPYRYLSEQDSPDLLLLLRQLSDAGKHVAIMAHVNHWREMVPAPFQEAVYRLLETGATIRTQSPVLRHINDSAGVWTRNWSEQVRLGLIPYYMFVERDTGANHYFGIPLAKALSIYQNASRNLSGLARTARGPVMSASPGKVQVQGLLTVNNQRYFVLSFLQARRTEWLFRPFLAPYSETAQWLDELDPLPTERAFFYQDEYIRLVDEKATRYAAMGDNAHA